MLVGAESYGDHVSLACHRCHASWYELLSRLQRHGSGTVLQTMKQS